MTKSFAIFLAAAAIPAGAFAQSGSDNPSSDRPAPPGQGAAKPGKASLFQDKFVDEGNAGAKALAEERGISVGEATRELRLMHAAGNAGARLAREDAASFGGVVYQNGAITVYVKKSASADQIADKARESMDQDLRGAVRVVPVDFSKDELRQRGKQLAEEIGNTDDVVGYRLNIADNSLSILSTNPARSKAAIEAKMGKAPSDAPIVQAEPIELTVDGYGGTAANTGVATGCPTFGFVVARAVCDQGDSQGG